MKSTSDHFELFGLPRRFAIDASQLESRYRDLQREVHPDRFAASSAGDQRASMEMATRVNDAYRQLRTPLARARYLLELAGVDAGIETNTAMPAEFLMQQMEWREDLEEAVQSGDSAQLDRLDARMRAESQDWYADLASALDGGAYDMAVTLVRKLMFMDKLREEIQSAHERLLEV